MKGLFVLMMLLMLTNTVFAQYNVLELFPNSVINSTARDINDNGEIIGRIGDKGFFLNSYHEIEYLDGYPTSINNAGTFVGWASKGAIQWYPYFLIYTYFVPTQDFSGYTPFPGMINDNGDVVGSDSTETPSFLWNSNNPYFIRYLQPSDGAIAKCINNDGIIGGWAGASPEGYVNSAIWYDSNLLPTIFESGVVYSINNYGSFVTNRGKYHKQDQVVHLDLIGCRYLHDINDFEEIVGQTENRLPFVWSSQNGLVELPGGSGSAQAINNNGMIVGYLQNPDRAVMWIPIPEPSSFLALGAGLIGLFKLKKRA